MMTMRKTVRCLFQMITYYKLKTETEDVGKRLMRRTVEPKT